MVSFRRAVVTLYFAGNAMFVASKLCVVAIWPAAEVSLAAPNETKAFNVCNPMAFAIGPSDRTRKLRN
jgi:hypothetical protein